MNDVKSTSFFAGRRTATVVAEPCFPERRATSPESFTQGRQLCHQPSRFDMRFQMHQTYIRDAFLIPGYRVIDLRMTLMLSSSLAMFTRTRMCRHVLRTGSAVYYVHGITRLFSHY